MDLKLQSLLLPPLSTQGRLFIYHSIKLAQGREALGSHAKDSSRGPLRTELPGSNRILDGQRPGGGSLRIKVGKLMYFSD